MSKTSWIGAAPSALVAIGLSACAEANKASRTPLAAARSGGGHVPSARTTLARRSAQTQSTLPSSGSGAGNLEGDERTSAAAR
jgi:hypothetical protein